MKKLDKDRFQILFDKYLTGNLTDQECLELEGYIADLDEDIFSDTVDKLVYLDGKTVFEKQEDAFQGILDKTDEETSIREKKMIRMGWVRKIAAIFLVASTLAFLWYWTHQDRETQQSLASTPRSAISNDIELPRENALITLADGKQMDLDEIGRDTMRYKGLQISKLKDGTVVMNQDQNTRFFQPDEKHRFTTPKGVMLRLVLPDASVAYINSNSTIEIFASFGKEQRQVELSGEAFFEVTHNKELPFTVRAKNTLITVLGTKFNMSAYNEDKQVKTALVSGSVQVETDQNKFRIKPGDQAIVDGSHAIQLQENVDMSKILAWRDGYFRFKDEPIRAIMADLEKWYPIEEVEFKAGSSDRFSGSIKRSKRLKDVLENIEQVSDLRFDIQERRVIVMK